LPRRHHIKIRIGRNAEKIENARAHVGVLASIANRCLDTRALTGGDHHRGELDRLRPRAQYDKEIEQSLPIAY
jgi:hypothetical protein